MTLISNISPVLEKVQPEFGSSFLIKQFYQEQPNQKPTWHYHPELELVYIENGSGKIHVGQHLSYFKNGTLVLIGPNLPHLGFVERMSANEIEIVAQFKIDFLGSDFFNSEELQSINKMLVLSSSGLKFNNHVHQQVGESLKELLEMNNFNKLIYFLKLLQRLSKSSDYEILNVGEPIMVSNPQDNDRLDIIFKYVRNNFNLEIKLDKIASLVNMSPQGFCRYFKKTTRKTFLEYVNEYKVVHATKLMAESNLSLTEIADDSGFNNKSHFINIFKRVTQQTPSAYRNGLLKINS